MAENNTSVITINGNQLDPAAQRPLLSALGLQPENASTSNHILVQTKQPLSNEQELELKEIGVKILEYVSTNTYMCELSKRDKLSDINDLDYVSWVNDYLDHFVVDSSLKSSDYVADQSPFPTVPKNRSSHLVDIGLHKHVDPDAPALREKIGAVAHADPDVLEVAGNKIRVHVENQYLDDLAAVDEVRVIEPVHKPRLFNNRARAIMGAPVQVNGTEFRGDGEFVAVADTGFDIGRKDDVHPAFTDRVSRLYALGRPGKSCDPDGHGTHVCGSVLGDGNSALMGGDIRGTAPGAKLVLQSLLDRRNGLGGIPSNLYNLFLPPYRDDQAQPDDKAPARIHTNSWGSSAFNGGQLPYNQSSEAIDRFVWDHKDMVILFAAGNSGVDADRNGVIDPQQIGAEGAAKNCITVGASENGRPEIPIRYGSRWPRGPITTDLMADRPDGMAAFSSRGPTKQERIKPDIVAPGTAILSTRSRKVINAEDSFGHSDDPAWWFLAGTSMATPLVAGGAAVLRESLVKNETPQPTAALIKALLINGAVELTGQYIPSEAGPSPNGSSGFGRVNLTKSVILPSQDDGGFIEGEALAQGQHKDIDVNIPQGTESSDLKVTLVWTDPPGTELQNDLDLIVIGPDGKEKHGNMGDGSGFDRKNNVEQVVWKGLQPGSSIKVRVYAFHIFQRDHNQPYAVVWTINRH
ncbi:subtilisin-like protein [Aspergillus sclerotioniger CBS 115572]|uniref:Subtilisin-like protein n=1 Tax=Aspergillus sclerotioniger CBS 115572 TaxID=1450535 RepID=A0A317X5J8_9EURO|nr:subtilisin-like protein [Aspergillus sclerotioniger CBS 115572]PWY93849.1 subtilisin-like protein [Aspergillus sclerotioniger CBS 115572]